MEGLLGNLGCMRSSWNPETSDSASNCTDRSFPPLRSSQMQFKKVAKCVLFVCVNAAFVVSGMAQQAGPPAEMKPPGDPTANTRPTTSAPATPTPSATAPEPAPVT